MAIEEYQNAVKEILRGVQYMIEEAAIKSQTQIYNGIYLGNGEVQLNGKVYTLPQYGGTSSPAVGSIVKVFVPNGNMSMAFFFHITQGGGGETTDHGDLTGRDAENQHPMSAIAGLVSALAGKQPTISDLDTIRSGAALGATALQSYTETDPVFSASPAASITSGNISSWDAKGTYSKPSGGIPKSDLASVVQTSLDLADTAIQDVSGKEDKSNKVSSWSSTPDNTHYPSEKLVKDSLDGKSNTNHTHDYVKIQTLPTNADLNTYRTSGIWYSVSTATMRTFTNTPSDAPVGECMLEIRELGSTNYVYQQYTAKSTLTYYNYGRVYNGGTWSVWKRVAWNSEIPTESTVSGWGFTKNTGTVTTTGTMTANHVVVSNGTTVVKDSGYTIAKSVPSDAVFTDTTYESKSAVSGGTAVSLVTTGEKYTWNNKGTYSKPSGGIPKTDLADVVQESLSKADTALQSFTETDPTVPSWAKAATKPTYTASEVGAVAIAQGVAKSGKFLVVGADGNVTTGEGGGGNSDIFIATYGTTTGQEIFDAYYAGKVIVAKKNDKYALMGLLVGASNIQFYRPNFDEYYDADWNSIEYPTVERWLCQGSTWSTSTYDNAPQHSSSHHSDGSDPIAPSDIGAIPTSQKGAANGVASLGADGKVPLSQLPVYDGSVS